MRILFSSLAGHGHLYPMLPLAIAARQQGDEVLMVTGAQFAPVLEPHDITFVPGGIDMRTAFAEVHGDATSRPPQELLPELIAKVFGSAMPRRFHADLTPVIADWRPDLVIHGVANSGAGLAADVAGVPALGHGFGRVWDSSAGPLAQIAQHHFVEFAAELGVEAREEDRMLLGHPLLDVCPPSFQSKEFLASGAPRIPLRPVPFAEPGELPAWVTAHDRPLVYLTLGTAFGDSAVLRTAIDGLATLDARVLVATGPTVEPSSLGELPPNVTVRRWLPQADLLPHADLVVHHGGSGTTMGAFGAGVPQLIVPQGADQFSNAEHVTEAGLGDRLLGEAVTSEAVAARAAHLLADEVVRGAAKLIAEEVATLPTPAEVAATLPDRVR